MTENTTEIMLITTPNVTLLEHTQYRLYDGLIAAGFCICFVVGLPGNCLALSYFIRTKKRNLSTLLYKAACSIDIISSAIHLPLTFNLFNARKPGFLGNKYFCSMWYFILMQQQQMSAYVVMLMSLSRAIAIVFPFYRIKKYAVVASIFVYLFYQNVWIGLEIFVYGEYYYSRGFGYCGFITSTTMQTIYRTNFNISIGLTPIIVFTSMLVSIFKLRTQDANRTKRRSSITIVYFTALFLSCNLITLLNNVLYNYLDITNTDYPGPIYDNNFMFFYSWIFSEIFCVVLNASLNPVLYLLRMERMRIWLQELLRGHTRAVRRPRALCVAPKQRFAS